MAGHSWTTPKFGTAGNLWHCRDALLLDTAGILCQDTLWFDNAGKPGRILGWAEIICACGALQDTLRLSTAGIFCAWALPGCAGAVRRGNPTVGHCRESAGVVVAGKVWG